MRFWAFGSTVGIYVHTYTYAMLWYTHERVYENGRKETKKKIKNSDERLKSYSTRLPSSESGCRLRL